MTKRQSKKYETTNSPIREFLKYCKKASDHSNEDTSLLFCDKKLFVCGIIYLFQKVLNITVCDNPIIQPFSVVSCSRDPTSNSENFILIITIFIDQS